MNLLRKFRGAFLAVSILLNFANAANQDKDTKIIVGGEDAEKNEFPWIVHFISSGDGELFCGGSIINKDWILTAAHCFVDNNYNKQPFDVIVGDHDLDGMDDGQQTIRSSQVITHEGFNNSTNDHDVALIKLNQSLDFTKEIAAIDLPPLTFIVSGIVTVAGWGKSNFSEPYTLILQKVNVITVPAEECKRQYQNYEPGPRPITENMVCAASPGKDSCTGDSGGPLMCRSENATRLCGVVSFGNGCANEEYAGVYAKVTSHLDWIQEKMKENSSSSPYYHFCLSLFTICTFLGFPWNFS